MQSDCEILALDGVSKTFRSDAGVFHRRRVVHAVREVQLGVKSGEALGLVGESGSGKTTLARLMVGLLSPTHGHVRFEGQDLAALCEKDLNFVRRGLQIVFQDAASSLDPQQTVFQALEEVSRVGGVAGEAERVDRIRRLLTMVDLRWEDAHRYPHEMSGGQCQRVGIARALAMSPRMLVADEPVSHLDVSTQAQILKLLGNLRTALGLTLVLVAHDLSVVRQVVDRVAVMYGGLLVEVARAAVLFSQPLHPYTQLLLESIPRIGAGMVGGLGAESEEPPGPKWDHEACPFAPRCGFRSKECMSVIPPLAPVEGNGHQVRCLRV